RAQPGTPPDPHSSSQKPDARLRNSPRWTSGLLSSWYGVYPTDMGSILLISGCKYRVKRLACCGPGGLWPLGLALTSTAGDRLQHQPTHPQGSTHERGP